MRNVSKVSCNYFFHKTYQDVSTFQDLLQRSWVTLRSTLPALNVLRSLHFFSLPKIAISTAITSEPTLFKLNTRAETGKHQRTQSEKGGRRRSGKAGVRNGIFQGRRRSGTNTVGVGDAHVDTDSSGVSRRGERVLL